MNALSPPPEHADENEEDRLERYRIEGAVAFIGGIINGAREDDDAGLLLCAENAEKAIRRLRMDKATLRADNARLRKIEVAARDLMGCMDGGSYEALVQRSRALRAALALQPGERSGG